MSVESNRTSFLDGRGVGFASPVGLLDGLDNPAAEAAARGTERVPRRYDRVTTPQRMTQGSRSGNAIPAGQDRMADSTTRSSRPAVSGSDTAWQLAAAARSCLTDDQRTMVFIEIGSGENYLAIERILTAVAHVEFALSRATVSRLSCWLDAYRGSPDEHRLRELIGNIPTT